MFLSLPLHNTPVMCASAIVTVFVEGIVSGTLVLARNIAAIQGQGFMYSLTVYACAVLACHAVQRKIGFLWTSLSSKSQSRTTCNKRVLTTRVVCVWTNHLASRSRDTLPTHFKTRRLNCSYERDSRNASTAAISEERKTTVIDHPLQPRPDSSPPTLRMRGCPNKLLLRHTDHMLRAPCATT